LAFTPWRIWLIFENFQGDKQKNVVADTLSLIEIDNLKIQEEEVLKLFSGSEIRSIMRMQ
jgi:hypothetical protein